MTHGWRGNRLASSFTIDEVSSFMLPGAGDGISVGSLLSEVKEFAVKTFDFIDRNGNGFLSKHELEVALTKPQLNVRERSYVRFLLCNLQRISDCHDDGDSVSPCGISRKDIAGISRVDLVHYFGES